MGLWESNYDRALMGCRLLSLPAAFGGWGGVGGGVRRVSLERFHLPWCALPHVLKGPCVISGVHSSLILRLTRSFQKELKKSGGDVDHLNPSEFYSILFLFHMCMCRFVDCCFTRCFCFCLTQLVMSRTSWCGTSSLRPVQREWNWRGVLTSPTLVSNSKCHSFS